MIVYWSTDYQSDTFVTAIPEELLQPDATGRRSSAPHNRRLLGMLHKVFGTHGRFLLNEFQSGLLKIGHFFHSARPVDSVRSGAEVVE